MIVNDQEITIYELDTEQKIIVRIASILNTIPKYLYFPNGGSVDMTQSSVKVIDILSLIKKNAKKSMDFPTFLTSIEGKIGNLNVETDLLYPWLAYNMEMENLARYNESIIIIQAEPLVKNGYFSTIVDFQRFWSTQRSEIKSDLEEKVKANYNQNKRAEKLYEPFEKIEEGIVYTDFVSDRLSFQITLDFKELTILEIFNYIRLNENVPFATVNKYYKILNNYIPFDEWVKESNENLSLKVCERPRASLERYKDYVNVDVGVEKDVVLATMKIITERGYLSKDQFIERFLNVFRIAVKYSNLQETEMIGIFQFPKTRINTYVLSDLIMNDTLFSSLITVNESAKATKKKIDNNQPWLYLYFQHPSTGSIHAGISQKIADRGNIELRETDPDIFPHSEPYIRVRIRGKNLKSIQKFQEIFSKLMILYEKKYNEIVNFYTQYIPTFGTINEFQLPPREMKPDMIAPEVFVRNYTRSCSDNRMTTIVSKDQAGDHETMLFPRSAGGHSVEYPSDGKNQQYYVCLNPEYPYTGIQHNNLENSEDYPFIPCCFKNKQNKKNSLYRQYFFDEEIELKNKKQQDFITTDKILLAGQYGFLPEPVTKMFEILDSDSNYKYIRSGVPRSQSSFLFAVAVALNDQTGILEMDNDEQENWLQSIREEMETTPVRALSRQCDYNIDLDHSIGDMTQYLDPNHYVQVLEGYFDCNIYLFNKERLFLPNFTQSYYKKLNNSRCIFIYVHSGSESDRAKYPQCEGILRWNTKNENDVQFAFDYNQAIGKKVNQIFEAIRKSYSLNNPVPETEMILASELKLISQYADAYGKTRQINIEYDSEKITILTSPRPQLICPITNQPELWKTDSKTALAFFEKSGATVLSQTIFNGKAREINAISGTVKLTIPINDEGKLKRIPVSTEGMHSVESESISDMEIYNQNKKFARYITEYTFWMFSKYISGEKVITDKILQKFGKKNMTIIKDFKYVDIKKRFSLSESGVIKDGKLVVTSIDMYKRLLYVVKLYSIRDLKSLLSYSERKDISHYYEDITDFMQYANQIILYGEQALDNWIHENRTIYTLKKEIEVGTKMPYFFKNKLIEDKVFLAQNSKNLKHAIAIANNWNTKGYNIGNDTQENEELYNFTLYNYRNENTITVQNITNSKESTHPIRIIGYKLQSNPYYTTLLDLDQS